MRRMLTIYCIATTFLLPMLLPAEARSNVPQEGAAAPDQAQDAPQLPPMRRLQSEEANLSMEIPESWVFKVIEEGSYLFEGPEGSEGKELAVLLQFIPKSGRPGSTSLAQLGEGLARVIQVPDTRLQKLDQLEVAGIVCPYFLALYTSQDTKQRPGPFGHLQLVIDHGNFYYWLTFLGPQDIFDRFTPVFQHLLGSIQFIRD